MPALKANWIVQAGLIPGEPMPEFTKNWYYTSEHFAEDNHELPEGQLSIFQTMMTAAHDYSLQLNNPTQLNWVRLDFIWL